MKQLANKKQQQSGFTLIELVVVCQWPCGLLAWTRWPRSARP